MQHIARTVTTVLLVIALAPLVPPAGPALDVHAPAGGLCTCGCGRPEGACCCTMGAGPALALGCEAAHDPAPALGNDQPCDRPSSGPATATPNLGGSIDQPPPNRVALSDFDVPHPPPRPMAV
ncbi:MAG: hypothetical protein LJE95_04925 [Acidobacteria bacterium]|nr:hypothetical protein [Acidobacteriota bacterium]